MSDWDLDGLFQSQGSDRKKEKWPEAPPSSLSSSLSCPAGLNDWDDDEILASVLAVSQQEYLDSMKKNKVHRDPPPDKS